MTFDDILAAAYPVLPVLVIEQPDHAIPLAETLVAQGVRVLEITLRTDAALAVINTIARHVPEAIVGAGTVLTLEQLQYIKDAGAQFAVSPGITERLLTAARRLEVALLPGVATASEVQLALECGYERLKFFSSESSRGAGGLAGSVRSFPPGALLPHWWHSCTISASVSQAAKCRLCRWLVACLEKADGHGGLAGDCRTGAYQSGPGMRHPITGYALPELLRLPSIVANTIRINWLRVLSIILISCSI